LRRQAGPGVQDHEPPHRMHGIYDPNIRPNTVMAINDEEERGRFATANLQQVQSTKIKMHRVAQHLAVEADAERAAHQAVRAIASDEILSLDTLVPIACEIDDLCVHAARGGLKRFEPRPITQSHTRKCKGEIPQYRIEPHLRTLLQPHWAMASV